MTHTMQITLSANNMWGIIHMIVELLMKHDDGKYVMMKVRTEVCMICKGSAVQHIVFLYV